MTLAWVVVVLLWLGAIGTALGLIVTANSGWRIIAGALLACAAFALAFPRDGLLLHGLEYEDAYEYASAAALLGNGSSSDFLNPICLYGSLQHCYLTGSLSHPIGYSGLIGVVYALVGFNRSAANYVSLVLYGLTTLFIFLSAWTLYRSVLYCFLCCAAWILTPSFQTLGATSFSEPASAALVSLSVLIALTWVDSRDSAQQSHRLRLVAALGLVLLLAIMVRRDNLALLVGLPVAVAVARGGRSGWSNAMREALPLLCAAAIAGAVGWMSLGDALWGIERDWGSGGALFSGRNAVVLGPAFFRFLADWRYYGPDLILFGLGLTALPRNNRLLVPAGVVFTYWTMFVSFGQSFYFVTDQEIPWIHFERYAFEVGPLMVLLVGLGALQIIRWIGKLSVFQGARMRVFCGVIVAVAACVWQAHNFEMRRDRAEEEQEIRIRPIQRVCRAVPAGSVVIAAESVLLQLYCGERVKALSYSAIGTSVSAENLDALRAEQNVFYLRRFESHRENDQRWETQRKYVSSRLGEVVGAFGARDAEATLFRITSLRAAH